MFPKFFSLHSNRTSFLFRNILLYSSWITIHFATAHLYARVCTPVTIVGFLTSPFMAASPHCVALRWVLSKSGDTICVMWMVIGNAILLQIDGFSHSITTDGTELHPTKNDYQREKYVYEIIK